MTIIESKLIREGGTHVDIGGTEYYFAPNDEGAHVCEVVNEDHADRFLSIPEGYRLYRAQAKAAVKIEAEATPIIEPVTDEPADERASLAIEYERLYGKAPHHKVKVEKLRELIAAKQ